MGGHLLECGTEINISVNETLNVKAKFQSPHALVAVLTLLFRESNAVGETIQKELLTKMDR